MTVAPDAKTPEHPVLVEQIRGTLTFGSASVSP